MPRGKKRRKNNYNENALITRLIQISMKMDDHIYNDQLVTRWEASAYLQEITTLKLRCLPTNVRALQVIEKLTRFMTLILNEEGANTSNSQNQSFQMTNEFAGSASPVYSLPDEDRNINFAGKNDIEDLNVTNVIHEDVTHKEMDIFYVTDDNVTHEGMDITNVTDDDVTNLTEIDLNDQIKTVNKIQVRDDSTYNKNTIEDIEVIDITNDSDIEEGIENVSKINHHNIAIERVNTGMSTMSLQDKDGSLTQCDDNTYSQSILDNYDNNITKLNEVAKEKDRTKGVEMVFHGEINAKTDITNKVNKHFTINAPLAVASNNTIADLKLMVSHPKNVVDVNRKPAHQHPDIKENTDKGKKVTSKNNNKVKRQRTKKNKELKVNETQICLDNAMNSKDVNIHYNGKENHPKTVKKPKNHKKVNEIYNENIENDLSWVENLRYVREISPSEFDPALNIVQDNFWDNFELPGTWDDLDFSV